MAFLVSVTKRAERDFANLYDEVNAADAETALRWYRGLKEAILSLAEKPNRCPVIAEEPKLRHFLYGRKSHVYRIIFRVIEKENRVEVLHIRHGAMERARPSQ
jgi:plasmid stabilization system protein ParE